jgi:hypothetical protein
MTFLGRYDNHGKICRAFRCVIFFILSLSSGAYAIPISIPIKFNTAHAINSHAIDGDGVGVADAINRGDMHNGRYYAEMMWPLAGNGSGGPGLLYGSLHSPGDWPLYGPFIPLSMPFATGLPGSGGKGPIFESLHRNADDTEDIRGWYADPEAMADFLAGLDFLTTDWQADVDHASVATHEVPASPAAAIVRRNPRECFQGNHEQKRGVQESLCTEGSGLAGSGAGSSGNRSSGSGTASLAGRGDGANGGSRNVIGVGDGIGGAGGGGSAGGAGGGGAGGGGLGGGNNSAGNGSVEGSSGGGGTGNDGAGNEGGGSPGGSSGIGNGGDIGNSGGVGDSGGGGTWNQGGNDGSGGGLPVEVRAIPEPAPLALLALGFAGMCIVRKHGKNASKLPKKTARR